jgi:hypothetical protein
VESAKSSHVTLNLPTKMQYSTQAKVVALANRSKLETLVKRIEQQWGDVVDEQWASRQFQVCPGLVRITVTSFKDVVGNVSIKAIMPQVWTKDKNV